MIDFPISFLYEQLDRKEVNYKLVMTGGGARIEMSGNPEDVSTDDDIMWSFNSSSFAQTTDGDSFPIGSVCFRSATFVFTVLNDTFTYDWANAELSLYAVVDNGNNTTTEVFIDRFRATNASKSHMTITLECDNIFLSNVHTDSMVDNEYPNETLPSEMNLLEAYQHMNTHIRSSFEAGQDTDCINKTNINVYAVNQRTNREILGDIGALACGGMSIKTYPATGVTDSFKFRPLDLSNMAVEVEHSFETGKKINRQPYSIRTNPEFSVTSPILLENGKTYFVDWGSTSISTSDISYIIYDSDESVIIASKATDIHSSDHVAWFNLSELPSGTYSIRFDVVNNAITQFKIYEVNVSAILQNWITLDTSLPVAVTDIKFQARNLLTSSYVTQSSNHSHGASDTHFCAITSAAAFSNHANVQLDYITAVKGSITADGGYGKIVASGRLVSTEADKNRLTWTDDGISVDNGEPFDGFIIVAYYSNSHATWLQSNALPDRYIHINYTVPSGGFPIYIYDENLKDLYFNSATLTGVNDAHSSQHFTAITNRDAFNNHSQKNYDYYIVVDGTSDSGEIVAKGYNATNVTWNGNDSITVNGQTFSAPAYVMLAYAKTPGRVWLQYCTTVGDSIKYNAGSKLVVLNNTPIGQNYVLDMTNNVLLSNRPNTEIIASVRELRNRLCGFSFYPFSGEHINLPFLEVFDKVALIDADGHLYFSFITNSFTVPYGKTTLSNDVAFGTIV